MSKISCDAAQALFSFKKFTRTNTEVVVENETATLYLFGNAIADLQKKPNGDLSLEITNAGWHTKTTKTRLNMVAAFAKQHGFEHFQLHTSNYVAHLNSKPWDGNWTKVPKSGHR